MSAQENLVIFDAVPSGGVGSLYVPAWDATARVLVWPGLDHRKVDLDPLADIIRVRLVATDPKSERAAKATFRALEDLGLEVSGAVGEKAGGWVRDLKDNHRIVTDDGTVVVAASRDAAVNGKPPAAKADKAKGKAAAKPAPKPVETRSSTWLDDQEFPPLKWVIPDMIPEGYTIVAGPPKLGKSWFVLAIILAIATPGGKVLGAIDTGPVRPVLYLDLEGSDRRLQQRSRAILSAGVRLPAFEYANKGQTDDLLETVRTFFARHGDKDPVVVVDTVAKLRTGDTRERGENAYEADYRFGDKLVELVRANPGSSLIGVFHRKKGVEGGDFVEAVSGSSGTTAAADTVLVAQKPRDDDRGVLHVTSRDAVGGAYAVRMTEDGGWQLDGDTLQESIDAMATRRMDERLGDDAQEVLDAAQSMPGEFTSKDVVEVMGGDTDAAKVGAILRNLTRGQTPRVVKVGRGTFRWAGGRVLTPPPGQEGVCVSD